MIAIPLPFREGLGEGSVLSDYLKSATSQTIGNVADLDQSLSEPSEALVASLSSLNGDLIILGAGGKMGPTFARMARRAFDAANGWGSYEHLIEFVSNYLAACEENPEAEIEVSR